MPMAGTELVALDSTAVTAAVPMAGLAVLAEAGAPTGSVVVAGGREVHGHKVHHADEDEILERTMTQVASKEKPERQFERNISAGAAHAAVDGDNHRKADGVDERRQRLVEQHKAREAGTPRSALEC